MRIEIEMTKERAEDIFAQAIAKEILPGSQFRVTKVTWEQYRNEVTICATDQPDPATEEAA